MSDLTDDEEDVTINRKTTLLLSEVLKLVDHALPRSLSASLQTLPMVMRSNFKGMANGDSRISSNRAFQIDSVNKTLERTEGALKSGPATALLAKDSRNSKAASSSKTKLSIDMDEIQFRSLLVETQVVSSANYLKWKWELINGIIEGPLQNPKRLEEAKSTKFLKRLIGFYRPFKYRFSDARNTKPNQRYVRTGCALMKGLLKTSEGVQYLVENKLLRQLAECLAQLDRVCRLIPSLFVFEPILLKRRLL